MNEKRKLELLGLKPMTMIPQPAITEIKQWTSPAVSKQTGIVVAANLSVKKFVDEQVLDTRMPVMEQKMPVMEQ